MAVPSADWDESGDARRRRGGPAAGLWRGVKAAAVALGLSAASLGAYAGVLIYQDNFHTVDAGILYRSAQPGRADLEAAARDHGVKSVLNLRGAHPGEAWYDQEVGASHAFGMTHYDYAISAKRFVTSAQIGDILAIVREAPKPLLIHCKSGSDRAGLVAALYRYAVAGASAAAADGELSLAYGHFPYLTSRSGAMDDSFWAFVRERPQPAAR